MLTVAKEFVKAHWDDIILIIGVILVSLFSFALGYIVSQYQNKESIKFQVEETSFFSAFVFIDKNLA